MPHPKVILSAGIPLLRGLSKPHPGRGVIAVHALAPGIHHAEVELRERMALVGSLAIPMNCLRIVLRRTRVVGEFQPKAELHLGVFVIGVDFGGFHSAFHRATEQFSIPRFIHGRRVGHLAINTSNAF